MLPAPRVAVDVRCTRSAAKCCGLSCISNPAPLVAVCGKTYAIISLVAMRY